MSDDTRIPEEMLDAAREAEERVYNAHPPRKAHRAKLRRELLARARSHDSDGATVIPFPSDFDQNASRVAILMTAAAAAVFFVWCGSSMLAAPEETSPDPLAMQHGLRATSPATCEATEAGDHIAISKDCVWSWSSASAEFTPKETSLELAKRDDTMRIYKGKVHVEVDPNREREAPVLIDVGAGTIEVVGTAFTITQHDEKQGEVTLHRGKINFVYASAEGGEDDARERVEVPAGETLTYQWPREDSEQIITAKHDADTDVDAREDTIPIEDAPAAKETTPAPEPAQVTKVMKPKVTTEKAPTKSKKVEVPELTAEQKKARAELDAKELLEVRHLRRLGKHDEALKKLSQLEKQTASSYTREVISYEIGDIHSSRSQNERACQQWKRHIARYPNGRYAARVRESMTREGCSQ